MKKIIRLLILLLMICSLTGCDFITLNHRTPSTQAPEESKLPERTELPESTSEQPSDEAQENNDHAAKIRQSRSLYSLSTRTWKPKRYGSILTTEN